jgi:hypothetical protein
MDELRSLHELRSDVPATDPDARERARERVLALIGSEPGPRGIFEGRRRLLVVSAGLVAAGVVALLLAQALIRPQAAAAALKDLATAALAQRAQPVERGEFEYTSSVGVAPKTQEDLASGSSWTYMVDVAREVWLGPDGSGRIIERYSDPRFVDQEEESAWRSAGSPDLDLTPRKERYGAGDLTTRAFDRLPTDPSTLSSLIDSGAVTVKGSFPGELGLIAELLGESPASDELRAALLLVAARLDDLMWSDAALDGIGRHGVSVSAASGSSRLTLVFDPTDSRLLSYSIEPIEGSGLQPRVFTFLERGVVDAIGERPEGSGT